MKSKPCDYVCKKCYKQHESGMVLECDDERWAEGHVWCKAVSGYVIRKKFDEIPNKCPYALEHVVLVKDSIWTRMKKKLLGK